ncbi:MAG: hypothetical protein WCS24_12055, partial [Methanoculleus sp.]
MTPAVTIDERYHVRPGMPRLHAVGWWCPMGGSFRTYVQSRIEGEAIVRAGRVVLRRVPANELGLTYRFRSFCDTSIFPIDVAPVADIDRGNNHHIILEHKSDPVLSHTKRIQRTIRMSFQFFGVQARVRLVCQGVEFVLDS